VSSSFLLAVVAPALFVLIWSTGWIVAKYAAPHADPLTFLAIRFAIAFVVLAPYALIARAKWPATPLAWWHVFVSGTLIHALYLGGVWWGIKHGLSSGISGLITALQPLLTALLGPALLSERIGPRTWAGVLIGFAGVMLVLSPKVAGALDGLGLPLAVNTIGVLAITAGTFYQKRFLTGYDLRSLTAAQYVAACAVIAPLAVMFEPLRFDLVPETFYALGWSVIVLSIVATALMLTMINRGQVSAVASLIYLVPSVVAAQAWLMFGETLTAVQVLGMAVTAAGVYLATRPAR
jgi:drug/metabolite transporter (DMT)-like permease